MGIALDFLRDLLKKAGFKPDRRTTTSLLVLVLLLILLPIGLFLIRNRVSFLPRAAGELIQLGEGGCIRLNKDKKKVVDCATVPLKLINPFYSNSTASIRPSVSPLGSSQASIAPSPTPNTTTSSTPNPTLANCATSVSNGPELLAAMSCYRNRGVGGKITLPAGTIEVGQKISVPAGVTLAGAGINSSIIRMAANFSGDDALMANDSSNGQQNIVLRDFTLQGDGRRSGNSCCYGLKLQNINNSFVVNVGSNNFGIDGIYMGTRPNKPGVSRVRITGCVVNNNGRNGIALVDGTDNVIDGCQLSGNSANELVAAIDLEPDNGNEVSNNHIFGNNFTNNKNNGIQITENKNDPGGLVLNNHVCDNTFSGNSGTDFDDQGFGTSTSGCTAGNLNPPSAQGPSRPSFLAQIKKWLSVTIVKNVYALGLAPALNNSPYKDKLVSYWKFDESSGNSVADTNFQSASGTGTATNTSIVDGKFGKARMIGPGAFVSLPNIPEFGDNVMSIAGWVKPFGFPAGSSIWNQPEGTSLEFAQGGDGSLTCVIKPIRENQESTFSVSSSGGAKLNANQWNHVACTFDMSTLKLFINGQVVASGTKSGWVNQPRTGQPVLIGKNIANGQSINAVVDDMAYWNRALSDAEVAAVYNNGAGQAIDLSAANSVTSSVPPSVVTSSPTSQDSDDNFTGTFGDDSDDVFTGGSPLPTGSGVVRYRLAETQAGLSSAAWKDFASLPSSQNRWFGFLPKFIGEVFAQDSDDNFTGTSGDDSNDVFTSGSPAGSASNGGLPTSSGNPSFVLGKQFITTNFQLTSTSPGTKQIWVQYLHPDGTTRVDNVTFDLVDKVPQITGLACNLDISKQNLKLTVNGNYFGTGIGTVSIVSPSGTAEVVGWTDKQVVASLKSLGGSVTEGQKFQVKVVRTDGFESPVAICAVNKSLVSLGARIFCREPGSFDASDVNVTLLYGTDDSGSKVNKVEEKVTISKEGEINLKSQLQAGKSYVLSVKAPGSLRRNATFTASEGTTQVTSADGTPFILPVGDIAPTINPDGQINTLDRSELIRQWRILGNANDKQTGDFNRDAKVNSIDWACMQYDFGASDDVLPVEVPGSASGTITIPQGGSGTITIPVRSPSP